MSANEQAQLARAHLERVRRALRERDYVAGVVWAAATAQTAITALAEGMGIDTRKDHFRRAGVAHTLYEAGALPRDHRALIIRLNEERKRAVYEGLEPDLRGRRWDDVVDALEELVSAAEQSG